MSTDQESRPGRGPRQSPAEFEALYAALRRRATGAGGSPARIPPACVRAAAGEIRSGRTVTLAAPVETRSAPDNPQPAGHRLTGPSEDEALALGLHFATDRFGMNVHGDADSHLDALCHVVWNGTLHGGVSAASLTPEGATALSVELARDGIVGRGVLLDIPRLRGVPWLDPGDHVTAADLLAAERSQDVRVGEGDLLFVRVGHRRRRTESGPWNAAETRAGLHPAAMELLAERRVAALGGDGNNDTAPSLTDGVEFPVHVLGVHALGLYLLDYLQFEDLVPLCEEEGRWSFFCVVAPLRLPRATGSPVNPIAIL
ncbi:cyclase family protein [Streptomyces goshikiensis]|uniref:Cyclase family protein n=1 Tax=Streptomyces goshikiensis TaxID=1942 RepID=A0ABZ1RU06_9ACTN|nr:MULTISPECIES: cyclase family protein [Streptomyces]MBP0932773.1 cyclase family protein [Streptomyces sp. KCTC 0041BP]OKI44184.1 cyclase [Streptomyces sp. CB03578]PJN15890.1 cyclase [Streptomyces sp. CB02120-2]WSY01402.1 cyclase family protein [Streptomyces goshikiensis]